MSAYLALIHKDTDSDYGVSFPDLPGCVSAGSTLDEAIAMAKEALALHIEGLLDDDEAIPAPTPAEEIDRDDALLVTAIEVPDNLRVERINVTIPALALQRFDAFAQRHSMTRSGLFLEATHRWIAQETVAAALLPLPFAPPSSHRRNDDFKAAHALTDAISSERDVERIPIKAETDLTEDALMKIQAALALPEDSGEQLTDNSASETVAKRILWLARELEKAAQTLVDRKAPAPQVPKEFPTASGSKTSKIAKQRRSRMRHRR